MNMLYNDGWWRMLDWDEREKNHGSQCAIRHFDHSFHMHNKIESRQFRTAFYYYFGIWFLLSFQSLLSFPFFCILYSCIRIVVFSPSLSLHCSFVVLFTVHPSKLNMYNLVISVNAPYTTLVIYVLGYFPDSSMVNFPQWNPQDYICRPTPQWKIFMIICRHYSSDNVNGLNHFFVRHWSIFLFLPLKRLLIRILNYRTGCTHENP